MRRLWITDTEYPPSDEVLAAAAAAGADEVLHGVPETLRDIVPEGTLGFFEFEPVVPPDEPEPPAPEVIAAQVIAEEIDTRLAPSGVNSIAEVKAAIREGLDAAVTRLGG